MGEVNVRRADSATSTHAPPPQLWLAEQPSKTHPVNVAFVPPARDIQMPPPPEAAVKKKEEKVVEHSTKLTDLTVAVLVPESVRETAPPDVGELQPAMTHLEKRADPVSDREIVTGDVDVDAAMRLRLVLEKLYLPEPEREMRVEVRYDVVPAMAGRMETEVRVSAPAEAVMREEVMGDVSESLRSRNVTRVSARVALSWEREKREDASVREVAMHLDAEVSSVDFI